MPLSTVLGAQSLIKPGVCTTATRPASPYTGQMIYDTTVAAAMVYNGTAWAVVGPPPTAIFNETQAQGTGGGTFTSGSFVKRTLNTTLINTISGCSIASSVITLGAGTYNVQAWAPGFRVDGHRVRLQNTTASTTVVQGMNAYSPSATEVPMTHSFANTTFTLTGSTNLELQHKCQTTRASLGLGADGSSLGDEVYAQIQIKQIG